jgi:hypothetical protein
MAFSHGLRIGQGRMAFSHGLGIGQGRMASATVWGLGKGVKTAKMRREKPLAYPSTSKIRSGGRIFQTQLSNGAKRMSITFCMFSFNILPHLALGFIIRPLYLYSSKIPYRNMKKLFALPLLLLFAGFMLTSCQKEEVTAGQSFDDVQLRAGTWTVDQVAVNTFDGGGFLISTNIVPFGEGEEGGLCTFNFDDNGVFTLFDNGNTYKYNFELDGRVIFADNGDEWGLRKLDDNKLEVVLRGDEVNNPCQFSASGAVYYLTRNTK